jgi:transcriptional regulator with XRE-family HTH domain
MTSPTGGHDRISTKTKLANELRILGNVLARARERAGLKQFDVAARLRLPPSYLSKVENGTRRLDVIEFVQIANAMNLDAAELLHELENALGTRGPVAVEALQSRHVG